MSARHRVALAGAVTTLLGCVGLGDVFSRAGWFWQALFATAVVVVASSFARHVGLPRVVVPVVGLAALLVYLTVAFVHDSAWLGVLPSPDAVAAFATLIDEGQRSIAQLSPPVDPLPGILAITAAGIGAVALVVDSLAATWRRPALAGLPLLALYAVPASVAPDGAGWFGFVLAAAGYLVLLLIDGQERLARWGRATRRRRDVGEGALQAGLLLPQARRVGISAIVLAVVVPIALPGLSAGLLPWGSGFGGKGGHRPSHVPVINPILDLRDDLVQPDDTEVLRYSTADPDPAYLRVVTLDRFDGRQWSPSALNVPNSQNVGDGLPTPPGLTPGVPRTPVRTTVAIDGLDEAWLPLPYPATKVEAPGLWVYDTATFNVFSTAERTAGLTYTVDSLELSPTPELLSKSTPPPADLARYLDLPSDLPSIVRQTALAVTNDAGNDYERAVALQNWLRNPDVFTYDTKAPDGTGISAIEAFLARRSGFCVHFASTMAVMARALGIPARVDVGFTPGEKVDATTWSVSTHDAHAWPELYFQGVGWVPFEPTPAVRTGAAPAYTRAGGADSGPAVVPTTSASAVPTSSVSQRVKDPLAEERQRRERADAAGAVGGSGGGLTVPWRGLGIGLLVLVLLSTPAVARAWLRRRRLASGREPGLLARDAWRELRDSARDLGYAWPPSQTPRQAAVRIARDGHLRDEARAALERVGLAAERARYARTVGEIGDLAGDVEAIRTALAGRRSTRTRLRALLLPPTLVDLVTARGRRGGRSSDVADSAVEPDISQPDSGGRREPVGSTRR